VGVGLADHLAAGLDERPEQHQRPHDAGRHEQRRLAAEQAGDLLLQCLGVGVLTVDVVADVGGGHRATHVLGRPGDGVGAQVDHGWSLLVGGASVTRGGGR
jgi:hypothetical protein